MREWLNCLVRSVAAAKCLPRSLCSPSSFNVVSAPRLATVFWMPIPPPPRCKRPLLCDRRFLPGIVSPGPQKSRSKRHRNVRISEKKGYEYLPCLSLLHQPVLLFLSRILVCHKAASQPVWPQALPSLPSLASATYFDSYIAATTHPRQRARCTGVPRHYSSCHQPSTNQPPSVWMA